MSIHNLFPTPIGIFKFGRELNETELGFIKNQESFFNVGNTTSKNTRLLKSKELTEIRGFIEDSVQEYFKTVYAPKPDISIYLTQSWANYTEEGQHHHKHNHANSVVSGVFYPQADRAIDKIYFYRNTWQQIKVNATEYNPYNSESWWFNVGVGDLVLFPSDLMHMVEPKKGEETRISIAFNTFLKGHIGADDDLTGLYLGGE